MSAYTRLVSKIAILSDADDAPGGDLCSVQPGGNGGGGLYVDLSIAKQLEERNVRKERVDRRRRFRVPTMVHGHLNSRYAECKYNCTSTCTYRN